MMPQKILDLIANFGEHFDVYKRDYNETQTRRDFIDPFFKELGWDIDNEAGNSETYRDVVHEDRLLVGKTIKAPDYSFRIGGQRKFFVEAKKPSIDLYNSKDAVFQLRRYGWTAGLSLCILTDFEEFAVYQTNNIKPNKDDNTSIGRIFYCKFNELTLPCKQYPEFATNFDFLKGTFTKEAILKGRFDKFADKKKKQQQTFDNEFLKSIQDYRKTLAENIVSKNKKLIFDKADPDILKQQKLNEVVRKTIDRLIFLRIAEDRNIETEEQLLKISKAKAIYDQLLNLFGIANDKYNAGLFDGKNDLSRDIIIDDKPLKQIIGDLYETYDFSMVPPDILGSIYERFLGDSITFEGGKPVITTKPEVRKAGGVYYTPQYVVEYIVQNTVDEALKGRNLKTIDGFTVVDPACGSGAFLIVAYQHLLDWYLDCYKKTGNKKQIYSNITGKLVLTLQARKQILKSHIFGVDIDNQAVEVTKLSLLLKCLEGVTKENIFDDNRLLHEKALPNINQNIKCGNSLIGTDYKAGELFDLEESLQVNAFDWQTEFKDIFKPIISPPPAGNLPTSEQVLRQHKSSPHAGRMPVGGGENQIINYNSGFDCVIGNPPYGATFNEEMKKYLKIKYSNVHLRQIDSFNYFISQSFQKLLKTKGSLSFIVPNTLFFQGEFANTRKLLLNNHLKVALNLGDGVFNVSVPTCIFCVDKTDNKNNYPILYSDIRNEKQELDKIVYTEIDKEDIIETSSFVFGIVKNESDLIKKIASKSTTINDIAEEMASGISSGGDKIFKISKDFAKQNKFENELLKPVLVGRQMDRYKKEKSTDVLIYTNRDIKIDNFPNIKKYLEQFKEKLNNRAESKIGLPWFALGRQRYQQLFTEPKIIFRQTADSVRCVFDDEGYFCLDSILIFKLKKDIKFDYFFIMAVLNCKMSTFIYQNFTQEQGRSFAQVKPINIRKLFIPKATEQEQQKLSGLAQKMIDLNKQLAGAKSQAEVSVLTRQIAATDIFIDKLVYALYGLTDDEIATIEKQ